MGGHGDEHGEHSVHAGHGEHGGGEHHHAHASLFSMGEGDAFDLHHVVLSLCGLLFFTVVFEHGLHSLQHSLGAKDSAGNQLLQKAKDELMILGFISFCLTVLGEFVEIPHALLLPFEFAHVLVFIVALCLIAFVPAALRILQDTERRWDALDAAKADDVLDKLAAGAAPIGSFERDVAHLRVVMHAFSATMKLPPTFDFAVYQRHALTDHLLELLEVPAGSWAAVAATAALIHALHSGSAVGFSLPAAPGYAGFIALGIFLLCITVGLRYQMGRARVLLLRVLGVEEAAALTKQLKKVLAENLAYHRQSAEKKEAMDAQARETISISKRNLMAHAHGHEHSKEHDESDEHGEEHDASDTQATTAKKAGWKKLRAWVNQPLVNIAHVLHLDEEEQEHDVAHLRADGVFAWDSPHFAFQCCSATLMLTMFYAALLVMRYARSACESATTPMEAAIICALMTAPVPICTILISRAIADFSYVACLIHPNLEVLDEALTQTLETRELKIALRERFIRHFKANGGESVDDVMTLFRKFDEDSNGVMDQKEFKKFMEKLFGRRVAAKEVEMMFREVNIDEELTIDEDEFKGFIFGSGRFGEAGRYMKEVLSPGSNEKEAARTLRRR